MQSLNDRRIIHLLVFPSDDSENINNLILEQMMFFLRKIDSTKPRHNAKITISAFERILTICQEGTVS